MLGKCYLNMKHFASVYGKCFTNRSWKAGQCSIIQVMVKSRAGFPQVTLWETEWCLLNNTHFIPSATYYNTNQKQLNKLYKLFSNSDFFLLLKHLLPSALLELRKVGMVVSRCFTCAFQWTGSKGSLKSALEFYHLFIHKCVTLAEKWHSILIDKSNVFIQTQRF